QGSTPTVSKPAPTVQGSTPTVSQKKVVQQEAKIIQKTEIVQETEVIQRNIVKQETDNALQENNKRNVLESKHLDDNVEKKPSVHENL
ncbi:hypothetical protein P4495_29735, partial [Bacillus thuringiensis]|nr:hypothetical protein [Bacillus thuringiensis]